MGYSVMLVMQLLMRLEDVEDEVRMLVFIDMEDPDG